MESGEVNIFICNCLPTIHNCILKLLLTQFQMHPYATLGSYILPRINFTRSILLLSAYQD